MKRLAIVVLLVAASAVSAGGSRYLPPGAPGTSCVWVWQGLFPILQCR